MRKLLAISLSFIILATSGGVVVSKHYCLGKLKNTSYFSYEDVCCCPSERNLPCCDTKTSLQKVEDEHTAISFFLKDYQPGLIIDINFGSLVSGFSENDNVVFTRNNDPPSVTKCRLHLIHSQFLI